MFIMSSLCFLLWMIITVTQCATKRGNGRREKTTGHVQSLGSGQAGKNTPSAFILKEKKKKLAITQSFTIST